MPGQSQLEYNLELSEFQQTQIHQQLSAITSQINQQLTLPAEPKIIKAIHDLEDLGPFAENLDDWGRRFGAALVNLVESSSELNQQALTELLLDAIEFKRQLQHALLDSPDLQPLVNELIQLTTQQIDNSLTVLNNLIKATSQQAQDLAEFHGESQLNLHLQSADNNRLTELIQNYQTQQQTQEDEARSNSSSAGVIIGALILFVGFTLLANSNVALLFTGLFLLFYVLFKVIGWILNALFK